MGVIPTFDLGKFKFFFERDHILNRDAHCIATPDAQCAARELLKLANADIIDNDELEVCRLIAHYNAQIFSGSPLDAERVPAPIHSSGNTETAAFVKAACILRMCASYDFGQRPNYPVSALFNNDRALRCVVDICCYTLLKVGESFEIQ